MSYFAENGRDVLLSVGEVADEELVAAKAYYKECGMVALDIRVEQVALGERLCSGTKPCYAVQLMAVGLTVFVETVEESARHGVAEEVKAIVSKYADRVELTSKELDRVAVSFADYLSQATYSDMFESPDFSALNDIQSISVIITNHMYTCLIQILVFQNS